MRFNKRQPLTKKNEIVEKFIGLFLVFSVVYNSGSVLMTVNNGIGFGLMACSFIIIIFRYSKFNGRFKISFFSVSFILFILMIVISFIVNANFSYIDNNIRFVLIISLAYSLVKYIDFDVFVKNYIKTMKFLVIISLIPFCLINIFGINILQNLPIIENINGVHYYNGLLFYYYTYSYKRNIGVFWEPSIYSSLIIIAMVFEICFKDKKPSFINLFILLIGLITTRSAGGYFLLLFVMILYFFKNAKTLKSIFLQLITILVSLWSYFNIDRIINFLVSINPLVFGKFLNENSASILERSSSPLANIELFLNSPIFGQGLGKIDALYSQFGISQTSTSTYFMAAFGIWGILYTLVTVYGSYMQKKINIITRILIAIIILLIVNKEPHARIIITYIIMFYLIKPKS